MEFGEQKAIILFPKLLFFPSREQILPFLFPKYLLELPKVQILHLIPPLLRNPNSTSRHLMLDFRTKFYRQTS